MFQGLHYVPLLHARLAEIRAFQALEQVTKLRIFPIVKLRPWFNAASIHRAFEVVEEAIGEAAYGFDLDDTKFNPMSEKASVQEFNALFDPALGFENYYERVREGQFRIPVFRAISTPAPQIDAQLAHVKRLDRGLIVRVPVTSPGTYLQVAQRCLDLDINNTAFVFDCGWRRDALQLVALTAGLVNSLLDIRDDFEISVACGTFPDSFQDRGIRFFEPIRERQFFDEVRALVNRGVLTFGDWGSTRSPIDGGFARNIPRIDRADAHQWMLWRQDGDETYADICRRVVQDDLWDGNLDAWGNFLIQSTANEEGQVIQSAVMAAAVRVNLHLISQAHFDDPQGYQTPDTPISADF